MTVQVARKLFTVTEYDQMINAGIFFEDERLELIEGEIVEMSPIGMRHAACVNRLTQLFTLALGEKFIVSAQNPIDLSELTEPEPDIAILRPQSDFYAASRPTAEDVLLLIEVAETSILYDQSVKLPLYAAAGIPEVWIVDVNGRSLTRYHTPSVNQYQQSITPAETDTFAAQQFPTVTISLADVLGPPE